jgi:rRNA maturation protein Rpf1
MTRGRLNFKGVIDEALLKGADRLLFVQRWKGGPGKIEFYNLKPSIQHSFPVIYLHSTRLQEEIDGNTSVRNIVAKMNFEGDSELKLFSKALTNFFRVQLVDQEHSEEDSLGCLIFDRTTSGIVVTFMSLPNGAEIGPRLVVKNLIWSLLRE